MKVILEGTPAEIKAFLVSGSKTESKEYVPPFQFSTEILKAANEGVPATTIDVHKMCNGGCLGK